MINILVKFNPANEKQERFMYSTKKFLLMSGAVATGKSYCGCMKILLICMIYPGARCLICRKEYASLHGSTLQTLFNIIPQEMMVSYNQQKGEITLRTTEPNVYSTIIFSGLDKRADASYPTKIGSTEFTSIFVDEIVEIDDGDFQMLTTRLRYKIPHLTDEQNSIIPRQIFGATNPDAPTHFLYKFFFENPSDEKDLYLTTPYENRFLPEGYLTSLEENLSGLTRERLLFGRWCQSEGVIYKTFDPRIHVTKECFLKLKDYKQIIAGADSNYPLPRACVLLGVRGDGTIDVLDEFYKTSSHIEELRDWLESYYLLVDQSIYVYHDPSDPVAIDKLTRGRGLVCNKAQNQVIPGIGEVGKHFDNNLIRIHPCCVNLIKELQSYRWKVGKEGDIPVKEDDHLMDAIRYALYSHNQSKGNVIILQDPDGIVF